MAKDYATINKNSTSSIVVDGREFISVYIDLPESECDVELFIEFKGKSIYAQNPGKFYYFTVPVDWLNEIPKDILGTGYFRLKTWSKSVQLIYEDKKPFTVYVPEDFKPEISNFSVDISDVNLDTVNYALYGLTFPRFSAVVTPHSTSPIEKCRITGGGYDVWTDYTHYVEDWDNYNFYTKGPAITTWANTKFTLTVYDARGRKGEITSDEIYVQSYNRPLINSISAYRTDKDGISQVDGDHIRVVLDASISPIKDSTDAENNTMQCFLYWNAINGSGGHATITSGEGYVFEADKDRGYEIECVVRDKYMETKAYCTVLGDNKDFNIAEGGGGAAVGMKAEKGYFDVAHKSRFHKEISTKEEISSEKGLVSYGTGSRGDFLSFGKATRIYTMYHTVTDDETGSSYNIVDSWGDFNDSTTIGVYGVFYDNDVSSSNYYKVMNAPCEKAGTLRVFNATGNIDADATEMYLIQEYVVRDGSAIYRRALSKVRADKDTEWPYSWTFGSWYSYSGTKI